MRVVEERWENLGGRRLWNRANEGAMRSSSESVQTMSPQQYTEKRLFVLRLFQTEFWDEHTTALDRYRVVKKS